MWEEGITSVTFFRGECNAVKDAVRTQFADVVRANPWLAGRLVKTQNGTQLRYTSDVVNSDNSQHVDSLFFVKNMDNGGAMFGRKKPYLELCKEICKDKNGVHIGMGHGLIGKDKPVVLLTLAESAPGEFTLLFSISHAVADGRTYYEIFKMLQPGAPVRGLDCTRVQSYSEDMRDACGRQQLEWIDSPKMALTFTAVMLPALMGCGKKAKCYAFHLDEEKVAAAKSAAAEQGGVPYVTTNDLLTSGFFVECGTTIGIMGLDCRGKIQGVGQDLAGNYATALVLDSGVFGTPASLRGMYSSMPYQTTTKPLPGMCSCCCGNFNTAMVTNWSSFAGDLVTLEGCELLLHMPVKNPAFCVFDLMIPFTSGVGKRGVLCWTVTSDEQGLRKALPLGDIVSQDLFPF